MRRNSEEVKGKRGDGQLSFSLFFSPTATADDGRKKKLSPPSQSVFHVAHLRGLFPDSVFKSVTMANLDGEERIDGWREKESEKSERLLL